MKSKVQDVAAYILSQLGEITTMKLQKLVYYSQAWSLVWDDEPLFNDKIVAWSNGPVVPTLFAMHKGQYLIDSIEGDVSNLKEYQKESIDEVLKSYGNKSSQWLSDLTHMEDPWINARKGLKATEKGNKTITLDSMQEYYSQL